jgi:hypothetical protein
MKSILGLARDAMAIKEYNVVVNTHIYDLSCTEACASIKPVVGFEFIDLDSFPLIRIHRRCGQVRAGPVRAVNASGLPTVCLIPCRAGLFGMEIVDPVWLWFEVEGRSLRRAREVPKVGLGCL